MKDISEELLHYLGRYTVFPAYFYKGFDLFYALANHICYERSKLCFYLDTEESETEVRFKVKFYEDYLIPYPLYVEVHTPLKWAAEITGDNLKKELFRNRYTWRKR